MRRYIALVGKSEGGTFGAHFPDFPGCIAVARDLEATVNAAARALRLHVEGMNEERPALPQARTLEQIAGDREMAADLAGAIAVYIPLLPRAAGARVAVERVAGAETISDRDRRGPAPESSGPDRRRISRSTATMRELPAVGRGTGRVLARRIADPE